MSEWIYNGVEFQIGDRVKVVRDAEDGDPNGMGAGRSWNNGWIHAENGYQLMDGYIGLEFEVADIDEHGVFFSEDHTYGFPLSCMINLSKKASLPTI